MGGLLAILGQASVGRAAVPEETASPSQVLEWNQVFI
jgi:hypothetical protein